VKDLQKNVLVLVLIASVAVSLLAVIKELTKKDYQKTMAIEANKTRKSIFPDAQEFKKITASGITAYIAMKEGKNIGIIINGTAGGFGGDVVLAVGMDLAGANKDNIRGIAVLRHNETPGLGTKAQEPRFRGGFKGKNLSSLPEGPSDFKAKLGIDTITGATITSMAVLNGVKNALNKIKKFLEANKSISASGSAAASPQAASATQQAAGQPLRNAPVQRVPVPVSPANAGSTQAVPNAAVNQTTGGSR
jgi:electron transport complex protein RnfG